MRIKLIRRREPDIELHSLGELFLGQLALPRILVTRLRPGRRKAHLQAHNSLFPHDIQRVCHPA